MDSAALHCMRWTELHCSSQPGLAWLSRGAHHTLRTHQQQAVAPGIQLGALLVQVGRKAPTASRRAARGRRRAGRCLGLGLACLPVLARLTGPWSALLALILAGRHCGPGMGGGAGITAGLHGLTLLIASARPGVRTLAATPDTAAVVC